ncbi:ribonuclease domain-containing protein [Chryseobacterium sp.]|uniref:ribonuclease domain-containing protein n=1 Tax=Chryseobacterium sp. TaxID=1871047 RepID=UPI00388DC695
MNRRTRSMLFACLGLLFGMSVMYIYNNFISDKKENKPSFTTQKPQSLKEEIKLDENFEIIPEQTIDELTNEKTVIDFVKKNHQLPNYYLTKNEAKKLGWIASKGNLCEALPGRAIGGDKFGNREKQLPLGEQYYEADVNYHCGNRQTDRIIFTKNGNVYLTKNHYKTFEKQ